MSLQTTDVLIIGSGHAGGMAAKVLTENGIPCLMLNAGPIVDVTKQATKKLPDELPFRGFKPPGKLEHVFQASEFNTNVWVDEAEVPYIVSILHIPTIGCACDCSVGDRCSWSRQSFRLSDYELKGKSHDGFGQDWPLDHAELSPFYGTRRTDYAGDGRTGWPASDAGW